MIREVPASLLTQTVERLCIEANKRLPEDLCQAICAAKESESDALGRQVLCEIARNIDAAIEMDLPVCQDTGMAVIFADVGQDVHVVGGNFEEAIQQGVRQGYEKGYLRKSVVSDPIERVNTGDNTPAVIHTRIVDGDQIKLTVAPKGFGSENMSGMCMLTPSATREDIIAAVVDVVRKAGSNPCPPMVVGVGIGGDFEQCAYLAKKALCRENKRHGEAYYAALEQDMLQAINALGIGPQGFGGDTTALYLNIEKAPTHIAGLPLAVNIGCHVTRHASEVL